MARISGRVGELLSLDVTFYHGGATEDPFAIRRVDIYRNAVRDDNLVAQVILLDPDDPLYPSPVERILSGSGDIQPGQFRLQFQVPDDFVVPAAYFDVWRFIPADPGTGADLDDEDIWLAKCGRFWLQSDEWFLDDQLIVPRIGFEALDIKVKQPEVRTIEVGMMPLPLYDFEYNLITPILVKSSATISIRTFEKETLVDEAPMNIGLRQGSYRTNPFNLQYRLDSSQFLINTYEYRVTLHLPNGETRASDWFSITIDG